MLILLLAIVYPCRFKHFINDLIKNPCVTTMQFSFLLSNSRIILLHLSTVSILLSFCLLLFKNHCKRPIIFQIHSGILIEQSTNDLKGTSSTSISQYTLSGNNSRAVALLLCMELTYNLLYSEPTFATLTLKTPAKSYSLHALSNSIELHIRGQFIFTFACRIKLIFIKTSICFVKSEF